MANFLGRGRAAYGVCAALWAFGVCTAGPRIRATDAGSRAGDVVVVGRLEFLRAEIARHDDLYFKKAAPEISDEAYDRMKRELVELERIAAKGAETGSAGGAKSGTEGGSGAETGGSAQVGDDRSGRFPTWRHGERMMSLEKVYTEKELRAFLKRVQAEERGAAVRGAEGTGNNAGAVAGDGVSFEEVNWVVEPKYDGLAVSATYEAGRLVRVVTRGDGREGDEVTANARMIVGLPEELNGTEWPERIEVRGEVFVTFAEFARVNAERAAGGETLFANPRALAAGSLKLNDAAEVRSRGLSVVFYGCGEVKPESARVETQSGFHAQVKAWGLPGAIEMKRVKTLDEVCAAVRAFEKRRKELAFPTDGVVIKLDAVAQQARIGATEHAPRWAVAYKFSTERAATRVTGITIQVGRSGVLTPVAELEPVRLGGSVVARATLHNAEEIARLDVRVGDRVFVEKAGEIIPAVVEVDLVGMAGADRGGAVTARAQRFVFPVDCPVCGAAVVTRTEEGAKAFCPNRDCEAQVIARLRHFAGAQGVAIRGLGEETVAAAVRSGRVRTPGDFYRMTRAEWRAVPGVGGKTAEKLEAAVEASKRAELWRFVNGLGVPGVGVATSRILAKRFASLEELAGAEEAELAAVSGVGARQARELAGFFAETETRRMVEALKVVLSEGVTDQ